MDLVNISGRFFVMRFFNGFAYNAYFYLTFKYVALSETNEDKSRKSYSDEGNV